MDVDGTQSASLEHLPIEIFMKVFASLSLEEIMIAFSGLNSCIDSIIRSVRNANHAVNFNNNKAVHLLHLFPTQIGRLIVARAPLVDFTSLINLRSLTIKYGTYAQVRSLCPNLRQFKSASYLHIDLPKDIYGHGNKRLFTEIKKIQQWEFEKKFILDYCSMFGADKSSTSSNNTRSTQQLYDTDGPVIRGRIFPEKEPYCFASFLIQIEISSHYPFNVPEAFILEPIYHPNVPHNGHLCFCGVFDNWRPTTTLIDFTKAIINTIDHPDFQRHHNKELANEYRNNYEKFYETALEYTLKYGRPRH